MNSNFVNINVPLTPQSLTAFNISHPTTTLALPTTANQYATVGYVSSVIPTIPISLIGSNNIWTGTNAFNTTHPTTTLALPTLSNQYATVGYVSSVLPVPLNYFTRFGTFTNNSTEPEEQTTHNQR